MKEKIENLKKLVLKEKEDIERKLQAIEIVEEMFKKMDRKGQELKLPLISKSAFRSQSLKNACVSVIESNINKLWNKKEVTEILVKGGYEFRTEKPESSVITTLRILGKEGKIEIVKIRPGLNNYQAKKSGLARKKDNNEGGLPFGL